MVFQPFILKQLESARRIEIVSDMCRKNSLKSARREKRGSATRQKLFPSTRIPPNWQSFLRVDDSKAKLFSLLAQQTVTLPTDERKELYSTVHVKVVSLHQQTYLTQVPGAVQSQGSGYSSFGP